MIRRTSALFAAALAAAALAAAPAGAATVHGVVVHQNSAAHSFVVAAAKGRLVAVHAARSPRTGRVVTVRARRLRNGTFAATRVRVGRRAHQARIRGTVTHVSAASNSFVVSSRGVSLLVRAGARTKVARAAGALPALGTIVSVVTSFDAQGVPVAGRVVGHGADRGTVDLEGVVESIDDDARTLELSADDSGESDATITVHLPASFDIAAIEEGDCIQLVATLEADGSYTAVGLSGDDGADQADDGGDDQGDDTGDDPGDFDPGLDDPGIDGGGDQG